MNESSKDVFAAAKEKELMRLRRECEDVMNLVPVYVEEVPWEKRLGAVDGNYVWPWNPKGYEFHAECECPGCGVTAHYFVPKDGPWAEMHTCSLCMKRYLVGKPNVVVDSHS